MHPHDNTSSDVHLLFCPHCQEWKPATPQYFHRDRNSRSGLAGWCKRCKAERYGHRYVPPAREGHKCCRRCDVELPATSEFFYLAQDRRDGFYPYCKPCVKLIQQEQKKRWQECRETSPITEKTCCRCGEIKPVDEFFRAQGISDGYSAACRLCLSKANGFNYVPVERPGFKTCLYCGKELPRTTEFFYKSAEGRHGLSSRCKKCMNRIAKSHRERKEYSKDEQREFQKMEPTKICPRCKKVLPRTAKHFYGDSSKPDGLSSMCQACTRANVHIWAVENPDRVRRYMAIASNRRRARKRNLPDNFTSSDWQRALHYFKGCCAACQRPMNGLFHAPHADHWIPLSSPECPGTIPENMIPLCGGTDGCNQSKNAKDAAEWLAAKFGPRKAVEILTRIEAYFEWVKSQ